MLLAYPQRPENADRQGLIGGRMHRSVRKAKRPVDLAEFAKNTGGRRLAPDTVRPLEGERGGFGDVIADFGAAGDGQPVSGTLATGNPSDIRIASR